MRLKELDMCSLAERRHQFDMLQVYKILTGKDKVKKETWFTSASGGSRETRATADPLNLRLPAPRLELRRAFFSQRVPAPWNAVPSHIKAAKTTAAFKAAYRAHRCALVAAAL